MKKGITTKGTKGSEIYPLKLRELRAFVVGFVPFAFFAVKCFLWLRLCRAATLW